MHTQSFELKALQRENARLKRYIQYYEALDSVHCDPIIPDNNFFLEAFSKSLFQSSAKDNGLENGLRMMAGYFDLNAVVLYQIEENQIQMAANYSSVHGISPILNSEAISFLYGLLQNTGYVWLESHYIASPLGGLVHSFSNGLAFGVFREKLLEGLLVVSDDSTDREWMAFERHQIQACCRVLQFALLFNRDLQSIRKQLLVKEFLVELGTIARQNLAFHEKVSAVFRRVGDFVGAQRIFLCEILNNQGTCSVSLEWTNAENSQIGNLFHGLNFALGLPFWKELFAKDGWISHDSLAEYALFNGKTVPHWLGNSFFASPIFTEGDVAGFVMMEFGEGAVGLEYSQLKEIVSFLSLFVQEQAQRDQMQKVMGSMADALQQKGTLLMEKEQFLQHLLGSIPMGVLLIQNRKIIYVNDFLCRNGNHLPMDLVGHEIDEFQYYYPSESIVLLSGFFAEVELNGYAAVELDVLDPSGERYRVRFIGSSGNMSCSAFDMLLMVQDVTHVLKANQWVTESNERYRKILEKNSAGVVIFDQSKTLVYINPSACSLLGCSFEEIVSLDMIDFAGDADFSDSVEQAFVQIYEGEDVQRILSLRNRLGNLLKVEVCGTSIMLDGANHYYFTLRDVSRELEQESLLRQSEKKYRDLIENSHDYIIRFDSNGSILFYNGSARRDLFEKGLVDESALLQLEQFVNLCVQQRVQTNYEMELVGNEEPLVVDWSVVPESNEDGSVASILMFGRDFTVRKHIEIELTKAIEQTAMADRLKSAFLANMSHEIRTPVNAIVGFGSLLQESESEEERRMYIDIINKSSDNLLHLIDDIVDVAKIESGEMRMNTELVNVDVLLQNLYVVYSRKVKELPGKSIELAYLPSEPGGMMIQADQSRLYQILGHLIDNAIKFTSQGSIQFGYTIIENQLRCFVRDTGEGIEYSDQEVIFDLFRQLELHHARKHGGVGLGLSLCRKLINAMGGQIGLVSARNEGSEFYFTLPIQPTPYSAVDKPETVALPVEMTDGAWSDKVVLLVDEDSSTHLQVRRYLEQTGATLISVRSGQTAVKLLAERSDIHLMMVSDVGKSISADMPKEWSKPEFPVVYFQSEGGLRGDVGGPQIALQKPFSKEALLGRLSLVFATQ